MTNKKDEEKMTFCGVLCCIFVLTIALAFLGLSWRLLSNFRDSEPKTASAIKAALETVLKNGQPGMSYEIDLQGIRISVTLPAKEPSSNTTTKTTEGKIKPLSAVQGGPFKPTKQLSSKTSHPAKEGKDITRRVANTGKPTCEAKLKGVDQDEAVEALKAKQFFSGEGIRRKKSFRRERNTMMKKEVSS